MSSTQYPAFNEACRRAMVCARFMAANFKNKRTISALIDHGLDSPEQLLFMSETDINAIPGIGKTALAEIMKYKTRHLPHGPPRGAPLKLVRRP